MAPNSQPSNISQSGSLVRPLIALLSAVLVIYTAFLGWKQYKLYTYRQLYREMEAQQSTNKLLLGEAAPPQKEIDVQTFRGGPLFSRAEVERERKKMLEKYRALLDHDYSPTPALFWKIRDQAPWVTAAQLYYHGYWHPELAGEIGSELIPMTQPLILISPEFTSLMVRGDSNVSWDTTKVTPETLNNPSFPFAPKIVGFSWNAQERRAVITYHVTGYLTDSAPYTTKPTPSDPLIYEISAYNARDLGFNYFALSPTDSKNIAIKTETPTLNFNDDDLRYFENFTGLPLAVNFHNLTLPERYRIIAIPAQATMNLWHARPRSISAKPDFSYVIEFK